MRSQIRRKLAQFAPAIFALLLGLGVLSFTTVQAAKAIAGTTYNVSPTGNDGNDCLSELTACLTIQAAIDRASNGDTVSVSAGTYVETVRIDKAITLGGESGAVVKPDNSTPKYDGIRRPAVFIYAVDGVIIQGFEIDGSAGEVNSGIYAFNSNSTTIQNNVIHDITALVAGSSIYGAGVGIMYFGYGQGTDEALVRGNTVYNTGRMGIRVAGSQDSGLLKSVVSSNNTIQGNILYNTWQEVEDGFGIGAVQIICAKSSALLDNIIHDTGMSQYGIYVGGSSTGNSLIGNQIYNNGRGIGILSNDSGCEWGSSAPAAPAVHLNQLHDNTIEGLTNVDTDPAYLVDAENNWWGSASGPTHPSNPSGKGDTVSDNVDFNPWCYTPTCSSLEIIVDNSDSGFSKSGSWNSYGAGYDGGLFYTNRSWASAQWTPNLPITGDYEVFVWMVGVSNGSTDQPFWVQHAGGTTGPINANWTTASGGGAWVSLGTYSFDAGTSGKVLTNGVNGGGFEIADAVKFVAGGGTVTVTPTTPPPTTPPPSDIIIDNPAAVFTGSWVTLTQCPGARYQNNFRAKSAGNGSSYATFRPVIPTTGSYEVWVWVFTHSAGAPNAPYTVAHAGGSNTFNVDFSGANCGGGGWMYLGTFTFNAGTSGYVRVTDNASGGYVMADAVKFVPVP